MKFFKKNEQGLTPSQRATLRDEQLGKQFLTKMNQLQHLEMPAWIAHKSSVLYFWSLILMGATSQTTVTQDLMVTGVWFAAWNARKSIMKVFMKHLNSLEKNPQLSQQVELALSKIRSKKGYKAYTPLDKSAFRWVATAVTLGLAPPASYLNVIQRRKPELEKIDLDISEKVKKRWSNLTQQQDKKSNQKQKNQ